MTGTFTARTSSRCSAGCTCSSGVTYNTQQRWCCGWGWAALGQVSKHLLLLLLQDLRLFVQNVGEQVLHLRARHTGRLLLQGRAHARFLERLCIAQCFQNGSPGGKRRGGVTWREQNIVLCCRKKAPNVRGQGQGGRGGGQHLKPARACSSSSCDHQPWGVGGGGGMLMAHSNKYKCRP